MISLLLRSVGTWVCLSCLSAALLGVVGGCPPAPDGNSNTNDNSGNDNGGNDNANSNANGNDNNSNGNTNGNSNGNTNGNDNNSNGNTNGNSNGNNNGNANGNDNNSNGNANGNDNNSNGNTNGNDNNNGNDNGGAPPTGFTLRKIVQSGDGVPGQSSATFTTLGTPIIDAAGRVAFWGRFTGGAGAAGLYCFQNNALEKVVDDNPNGPKAPGRSTNDHYGTYSRADQVGGDGDPLKLELSWGKDGRLLFNSPVDGERFSRGVYRWRATDKNLIRVADIEQMLPVWDSQFNGSYTGIFDFQQPGVGDNGIALFVATYTLLGDGAFRGGAGVFSSNGSAVSLVSDILLSGDSLPEQTQDINITSYQELTAISPAGDFLFVASFGGGTGNRGVYLSRGGVMFRVVDNRSNASFPGLPAGITVGPAYPAVTLSNDYIAIETKIRQNNVEREAVIRFDWAAGRWSEVLGDSNAAARTLISGVNADGQLLFIGSDNHPYLAGPGGRTRIDASLTAALVAAAPTWVESGGSVNNHGRAMLRYNRGGSADAPGIAFWNGSQCLIVADTVTGSLGANIVSITTLTAPERDRPGRSGAMNDDDQIVFKVTLAGMDGNPNTADDVHVIYRADPQ